MKQKYNKRIVSKGEYLNIQSRRIAKGSVGGCI